MKDGESEVLLICSEQIYSNTKMYDPCKLIMLMSPYVYSVLSETNPRSILGNNEVVC